MFPRGWHVVCYAMYPWPRCSERQGVISRHWWKWTAKQAKTTYDEHEADRQALTLPAGFIPQQYRIERVYG